MPAANPSISVLAIFFGIGRQKDIQMRFYFILFWAARANVSYELSGKSAMFDLKIVITNTSIN